MNRRKFIASSSILVSTSLSGCLGLFESDDESDTDTPEPPNKERVDEPPYEIIRPSDNENSWNPNYLGTNQPTSPTLNFSKVDNATIKERTLDVNNKDENNEYFVDIIDNESDMESKLNTNDDFDINFNDEILVIIESGYGSSSLRHRWNRIEERDTGIHLYGYMYEPYNKTLDFNTQSSIVRVDKSNSDDITAHVSLTVDVQFRINFDSSEDVVGIEVITK